MGASNLMSDALSFMKPGSQLGWEWVRTEERFLAGAADMGLEEVVARVHATGGMAIPAHTDRLSFSFLSNLGHVPDRSRSRRWRSRLSPFRKSDFKNSLS